jgi:glucose-1-phosphate cytidylyltransferase
MLWHIMKIYSAHGLRDFIVCCGHRGYVIKEYFANYFLHTSDVVFDMANNRMEVLQNSAEPWRVTLVDTGEKTMTGGRLKRVKHLLADEPFCFTYGDGVSDVDIAALIAFHKAQGRLATLTAVEPQARFGALAIENGRITRFQEKPQGEGGWVNGGFFVLSPRVIDYVEGDATIWEREPLERLAQEGQLSAYSHRGFWHPMDTLRDRVHLEELWNSGTPPWKVW